MVKTLLEKVKIGEFMTIGCEIDLEREEIGLMIGSADVSAAIAFKPDEWPVFVAAVNEADRRLRKRRK